jgi:hypothetical protein
LLEERHILGVEKVDATWAAFILVDDYRHPVVDEADEE